MFPNEQKNFFFCNGESISNEPTANSEIILCSTSISYKDSHIENSMMVIFCSNLMIRLKKIDEFLGFKTKKFKQNLSDLP